MTEVDPFIWQLPTCFGRPPDTWTLQDSNEILEHHRRLMLNLHNLWLRTGGAQDQVQAIEDVITGDELELPDGDPPIWDGNDWQDWAIP